MILFDLPVYQFIINVFYPMISIMKLFTTFGSTLVIITGILCVGILFKDKKYFKYFAIANLVGVILNNLLKIIFRRPRPTDVIALSVEKSFSFPSGHSMMSMIFYGLIIYFVWKNVKNKWLRIGISTLLACIIFMVGVSRIYLGVHYATDVVGGFVVGLTFLVMFIKFYISRNNNK